MIPISVNEGFLLSDGYAFYSDSDRFRYTAEFWEKP